VEGRTGQPQPAQRELIRCQAVAGSFRRRLPITT